MHVFIQPQRVKDASRSIDGLKEDKEVHEGLSDVSRAHEGSIPSLVSVLVLCGRRHAESEILRRVLSLSNSGTAG